MLISEETRKSLQNLGLTDYETRVYVALLQRGALTASEASENTQVPYSKIYEILGNLEKKRLDRKRIRSPIKALSAVTGRRT